MNSASHCQLTIEDHALLEAMLDRCEEPFGQHAALLRMKLATARLWSADAIAPSVVTLDSRVSYRIGRRPLETRIVSLRAGEGAVGAMLPLTTLQGLALIGLAEGDVFELSPHGQSRHLSVLKVHFQPEAAAREIKDGEVARRAAGRPHLRLVHSADVAYLPPSHDHDDPGPSAA